MSKSAVIVALLVAIGLGIAALVLTQGKGTPAATGPLLAFNAPEVTELRVDFPDGSAQGVKRDGDDWNVFLRSAGKPERSWPAAQLQVHSALRIFAAMTPEDESKSPVGAVAGTLTIKAGSAEHVLKIGQQRLAGRVLVETGGASPRTGWVDANLAEMLITTGVKAWRNSAALPGVGPEASRVFIEGQGGTKLSLARLQGKWLMREPIAEPADPEAISRLFGILAAARIEDFCDQGPPSQTGLENPIAKLTIETDTREAGAAATTIRQSIIVGQSGDIAGKTVVAKLERSGSGGYSDVVLVGGQHLAAISTDPAMYLSKQAVRSDSVEVGQITLTLTRETACKKFAMRRTPEGKDGWESQCGEGPWTPATSADSQAAAALLELLTTSSADKISLRKPDSKVEPVATVQFQSLGGTPLGEVSIAIDGERLVVLTERARRDYLPGIGRQFAEWLARR